LTAVRTPPVCHRFRSRCRPLVATRSGRGASRAYAPWDRRRHARLPHQSANHAKAQSAHSRSIALGLSPCAGLHLHPPRPLATYSARAGPTPRVIGAGPPDTPLRVPITRKRRVPIREASPWAYQTCAGPHMHPPRPLAPYSGPPGQDAHPAACSFFFS
jgi:hypothetical protein